MPVEKVSLGKLRARVDFRIAEFDQAVQQMGARCLWSRALQCPCYLNSQTQQADPACPNCEASGWFYVKPASYKRLNDYDCDPPHLDSANGAATQILVQSVTKDPQVFEKFGEWIFGTVRLTPFSFIRLNYRDRITLVESVTAFQQILTFREETGQWVRAARDYSENLRYPAVSVLDAYKIDALGARVSLYDYLSVEDGAVVAASDAPLVEGDRVCLSYEYHPVLIVQDHVYSWRDTLKVLKQTNPVGEHVPLPHHAMAKLDFLIGKTAE